jgi:formamidopyrimidine-DNA glycosylase
MPELPEVETVRIGLARLLPGLVISGVWHDNPKSFPNAKADVAKFLLGAKILGVRRRAKVLLVDLSTLYTLIVHLKMTGQLVFKGRERFGAGHPSDSLVSELPAKSTHVTLTFEDKSQLFFNDQRKFGWMRLIPTNQVDDIDFFRKLGPEPLAEDFTANAFITRLERRKNTTIKSALLDQTVLAGVGNIYADESLWGAKIHPASRVGSLSKAQLKNLYTELLFVLNLAIEKGGSTDKNYVDAEGRKGSYLSFARVFRREGLACPRHPDTPIIKSRVAGRGTHTCPMCQRIKP